MQVGGRRVLSALAVLALSVAVTSGCGGDDGGGGDSDDSGSSGTTAGPADTDASEDGDGVGQAVSALVASGSTPEDGPCPLFTVEELAAAAGFAPPEISEYDQGTVAARDGLGDTVFCFFSHEGFKANVLVFTDTSAGVDGLPAILDAADLNSDAEYAEVGEVAGGTAYMVTLEDDDYRVFTSGIWLSADGTWGLSQTAPTLDSDGVAGTVELVRAALAG